jgi:hypothetical protein
MDKVPLNNWYYLLLSLIFKKKMFIEFLHVTNFSIQIAALSPADINYDETLSTLRYGKSENVFY